MLALPRIKSLTRSFTVYSRYALIRRSPSICTRCLATSTGDIRFPYPTQRNPTPHQIFHLPHSATENEIKDRYFDLVRIYHPDKASANISPDVAHARFNAITAAYDALRGKSPLGGENGVTSQARNYQTTAAWRAARQRRQDLYTSGAVDDRWKDKIILAGVIGTIIIVFVQLTFLRRDALEEAISRTKSLQSYHRTAVQDHRLDATKPDEDS